MPSFLLTVLQFFRGLRMAWQQTHFRITLILALTIVACGTAFYCRTEGWSVVDASYFCVMTLTTIGYGDLHPTRDVSKIFTIFYALVGIGVFVALVTQLAQAQIAVREEFVLNKKQESQTHTKKATARSKGRTKSSAKGGAHQKPKD
ncbi:potassium channel family protein [Puniceicoccus vermicola]|uniref:Two pore domain potassium channel family protein n=1 Tax=Puniceicoccus vermicola TaxID=388746 RepID=A0A7X1B0F1_9BACT|nr:potassium channel family protein [Puniceicoccus vermicola]MBC2602190.1 two pore domain potassium channel family protein [Puniceicoccus vermicola]